MKLLLLRCGICLSWHSPKRHCPICGAYHLRVQGMKDLHLRKDGVEMVRGIPVPVDGVISRLVKRMSA